MRALQRRFRSIIRHALHAVPGLALLLGSALDATPVEAQRARLGRLHGNLRQFALWSSEPAAQRTIVPQPRAGASALMRSAFARTPSRAVDDVEVSGLPPSTHTNDNSWDVTVTSPGFSATYYYIWDTVRGELDQDAGGEMTLTLAAGRNEVTFVAYYYYEEWIGGFLYTEEDSRSSPPHVFWYDDPAKTYGASVTPASVNATHIMALPGSAYTEFTVTNTGNTHQDIALSITCTDGGLTGCAFTAGGGTSKTHNLLNGSAPTFGVSYQINSPGGTGQIRFIATSNGGPAFADTGFVNVTTQTSTGSPKIQINMHDPNPGVSIERGACVTIPIERRAAVECGDLRVVHPLPSTMTMGVERAPHLSYLSRHAVPGALLGVDVTMDSVQATDLLLIMTIPGKDTVSFVAPWNTSWSDGQARRVTLPFNAKAKSVGTGVYTYTMQVWALNNGVPVYSLPLSGDTLVVVDRTTSPFGIGWWLGGLEQLSTNTLSATTKLWIGSDGSTRVYTRQSDTTVWIVTPTLDRPDTLRRVDSSGTTLWRRSLGNGAYVQFDNANRHVATVNELGHKTRFFQSESTLDSILLPVPNGSGALPMYRFKYATAANEPIIDTIFAPKGTSSSPRVVRVLWTSSRASVGIRGTDAPDMVYGYQANGAYVGRIDSVNVGPVAYGTGNYVSSFSPVDLGTTTLCPVEATGLSGSCTTTLSASASTSINGPRTDVADTSRIWHTRYGAPRQIRNALGHTTTIYFENTTFPMLATKVVSPSGFTTRTTYNSRGLVDSAIAVSPLGTSDTAKTRYTWHSSFNKLTQITGPTGDVVSFAYDTLGLLTYDEDGRGSSTRTNYSYDAARRLEYVQPPGHASSQRYRVEYDSYLGNPFKATTPLGFADSVVRDTAGRPIKVITPIDSNPSSSVRAMQLLTYNAWNCVISAVDTTYSGNSQPTYSYYSINGTAANTNLTIANTCSGVDVTQTNVAGISYAVTQNPYGRATCAGITCTYDGAGNITQRTTASGSVYVTYDALNRIITRRTTAVNDVVRKFPNEQGYTSPLAYGFDFPALGTKFPFYPTNGDTLKILPDTATYTYDSDGNLLTANNSDAKISLSYYPSGLVKTDTLRVRTYETPGNFTTHVYGIKYEYDIAGRLTKKQVPTNLGHGCTAGHATQCTEQYHYVAHLGAVDTITSYAGHTFAFGYDDKGRVTSRTAPGGVDLAWTYDLDDRVTRRQERRDIGHTPVTVHLDSLWYDARGKVLKAALAGTADKYQLARFAYDRHGYLDAAEYYKASPADTANRVYTNTPTGMITLEEKDKNIAVTNRWTTYDATGRVTAQSEYLGSNPDLFFGLDYSATAGPIVLKSALQYEITGGDTVPTGQGYESAAWHATDGKLRFFQRVGSDDSAHTHFVFEEYRYDAFGRRVLLRSRSHANCTANFCKPTVERFVWDGGQILFEMRVPGDSGLSTAALEADTATGSAHYGRVGYVYAGAPIGVYRNGVALVPHANWRGFVDAATDTTGAAVTATVTWMPQEEEPFLNVTRPTTVNGWPGTVPWGRRDKSGLIPIGARSYDPGSASFTQAAPGGLMSAMNAYGPDGDPLTVCVTSGGPGSVGVIGAGPSCVEYYCDVFPFQALCGGRGLWDFQSPLPPVGRMPDNPAFTPSGTSSDQGGGGGPSGRPQRARATTQSPPPRTKSQCFQQNTAWLTGNDGITAGIVTSGSAAGVAGGGAVAVAHGNNQSRAFFNGGARALYDEGIRFRAIGQGMIRGGLVGLLAQGVGVGTYFLASRAICWLNPQY